MSADAAKIRWVQRQMMDAAGKASLPRTSEPSLWQLLGWERDAAPEKAAPVRRVSAADDAEAVWTSESQASYQYYVNEEPAARRAQASLAAAIEEKAQKEESRRRYSLVAEEAAAKATNGDVSVTAAAAQTKKQSAAAAPAAAVSRRRRKKRLKAPRLAGPRPKFFNYGNSNTQRPWINLLQTHNVSPEDPREIYPNALHAATRHPKYQEIALEKAAFLAKHKEEVSQAADDLMSALAQDAKAAKASRAASRRLPKSASGKAPGKDETKQSAASPVKRAFVTRLVSNPPAADPSLSMWDLLAWPGEDGERPRTKVAWEAQEDQKNNTTATPAAAAPVPTKKTKKSAKPKRAAPAKPAAAAPGSGSEKPLPVRVQSAGRISVIEPTRKVGARRIVDEPRGPRRAVVKAAGKYRRFVPKKTEMIDPRAFGNLPTEMTKNIPAAGISSGVRQESVSESLLR